MLLAGKRPLLLVALVALLGHVTALLGGFVWLDHGHIRDGLALAPAGAWGQLLTGGFAGTGFYRPLMSVSLSLDAALGGAPWLYHATSLLWHAGAAVMVVIAGQALGSSIRAATLAGALFAVHPVTSLVASAIAFRSEAMITVALLALVVFHRRERPLAAALALLGGALTKETALVLGVLIIAALELDARLRNCGPLLARWRLLAAEAGGLAAAVALRLAYAPPWRAGFVGLSPAEAVGTRLAALGKSALALVVPVDRSICDAFPITGLQSGRAVLGLVAVLAVAYLAWKRRGPALLLALALLPALQLVPIMRWWSPHYLYLPLAFLTMVVAEPLAARGGRVIWAATAVTAGFAALALHGDLRFREDETLWRREVAAQPACREGHFYLGQSAFERGRIAEAAAHFQQAAAPTPGVLSYSDRRAALQNLGVARLKQGAVPEARQALAAALALTTEETPRRHLVHDLATVELRAGNAAESARLLEAEVARTDALPASILVRARALHQLGREAEAGALVQRLQQHARRTPR